MSNHIANNKRMNWLDLAKGFGIILIVMGHVLKNGYLRTYIYAFHVPLFFMLMGFTFKLHDFKAFLKKKILRNLIPYYFWSIISITIFLIMIKYISFDISDASTSLINNIFGMLYGNSRNGLMRWNLPLWFIPCMVITSIQVWVIERIITKIVEKKSKLSPNLLYFLRVIIILLFACIGSLLPYISDIKLPFQYESGIYLVSFFETGILLRDINIYGLIERTKLSIIPYTICLLLFVSSILLIQINGFAEIRIYDYGNYYGLYFLTSSCMCIAVIFLSIIFEKCSIIEYLGRNTFPILLMHKFPILLFQSMIPFTKEWIIKPDTLCGLLCAVMVTIISIILCLLGEKIIKRFCPIIIGATAL